MSRYFYGGQAVIEGVMMRGRRNMAIAVRRTPEEIVMDTQIINTISERYPVLKWPFIRGTVALVESLVIGVKALTYSANQVVEGEGSGEKISSFELTLSVVFAITMGVVMFFLLPAGLAHLVKGYVPQAAWQNMLEGLIRITIFLSYVWLISFMKDIQRVFEYHGAEHKVIYMYEANEELTAANAQKYSTLHPRCGTSFLLFVMVTSILVFSLLGQQGLFMRLVSRILLLPVVAGLSYELLRIAGKNIKNPVIRILSTPGLWLQRLTTREPDHTQLEVAICALKKVLEAEKEADKEAEKEAGKEAGKKEKAAANRAGAEKLGSMRA